MAIEMITHKPNFSVPVQSVCSLKPTKAACHATSQYKGVRHDNKTYIHYCTNLELSEFSGSESLKACGSDCTERAALSVFSVTTDHLRGPEKAGRGNERGRHKKCTG